MKYLVLILFATLGCLSMRAQELNCTVRINHSQVQGTNNGIFETLEKEIAAFMNNRAWTDLQYSKEERVNCTMNFTIKQYKPENNHFTGEQHHSVLTT